MLMTVLKIVAGIAVVGIITLVMLAVVWGIASSIREKRRTKDNHDLT
jgi:hypothetical protein